MMLRHTQKWTNQFVSTVIELHLVKDKVGPTRLTHMYESRQARRQDGASSHSLGLAAILSSSLFFSHAKQDSKCRLLTDHYGKMKMLSLITQVEHKVSKNSAQAFVLI